MPAGSSSGAKRARAAPHQPGRGGKQPIEKGRWAAKGTKPLPEQASVKYVLVLLVVHVCRKVLFIPTEVKVMLYFLGLFVGSLICDFTPLPSVYMGQRDNVFNLYYVKVAWAWLLLVVGSFILLTSATIGCGHREVIKRNMLRLLVGTFMWFFWTQWFFGYVENRTGSCLGRAVIKNKAECNTLGNHWHSFDISGHAFLLVYINMFILEEAKAIDGWEGIRDQIRLEDHHRGEAQSDPGESKTPLETITPYDMAILKMNYEQFTPYIRCIFCAMTVMSVLSDVMLACTIIFFHTMPQKVAGGAIGIATWFLTYRVWFKWDASPGLPGCGLFQYQNIKEKTKEAPLRRRSSICKDHRESLPTFMGMPLYGLKKEKEDKKKEDKKTDYDRQEERTPEEYGEGGEGRVPAWTGPNGDSAASRSWRR